MSRQRVKTSIGEVRTLIEETEREYARLAAGAGAQARRVADKLRDEWTQLNAAYEQRHDRSRSLFFCLKKITSPHTWNENVVTSENLSLLRLLRTYDGNTKIF